MLFIAYRSRSPQMAAAARLLALSWVFIIQLWIAMSGSAQNLSYGIIDLILACAFFEMSRKNWFPLPLFVLYAMLAAYHLYTTLIGPSYVWIAIFTNRAFELALAYVIVCAAYRIRVLRSKG